MTFSSLIYDNFGPVLGLMFLLLVALRNKSLTSRSRTLFLVLFCLEGVEAVCYNAELYTATMLDHPTYLRMLTSAIGYSVRPFILYGFLKLMRGKEKSWLGETLLMLPGVISIICGFSVFFTDIVYSYDAVNEFQRGPLGYFTYITSIIYIVVVVVTLRKTEQFDKKLELPIIFLILFGLASAMVFDLFSDKSVLRIAIILSTTFFMYANQIYRVEQSVTLAMENKALTDKYEAEKKERAYSEILAFLAKGYDCIFYLDYDNNILTPYKISEPFASAFHTHEGDTLELQKTMSMFSGNAKYQKDSPAAHFTDREYMRSVFAEDNVLEVVMPLPQPNGSVIYWQLRAVQIPDEQKQTFRVVLGFGNVTGETRRKEEERRRLAKLNTELQNRMSIIDGLSQIYFVVIYADLRNSAYSVVQVSDRVNSFITESEIKREALNEWFSKTIAPAYLDTLKQFTDVDTLAQRFGDNDRIDIEYESLHNGWAQAKWIAVERDENGTVTKALYAAEDIDVQVRERNEARQKLSDALVSAQQANRAKTAFLSNMSHDIRTPMNAIVGFASLAATHIENRDQVKDYLTKIMTASTHLLSLINDVLDMSRVESGRIKIDEKECCLPTILHDLRNILQSDIRAKRLSFFIDTVDVSTENIICDRLRLNQVLLNCISNAVKYTPAGGTVSIRVAEKTNTNPALASFIFYIKDTGVGMSEEFLAHLFEPFSREESTTISGIEGTGLGMAITKNLVDLMGGTIEVESLKNVGTEFRIRLTFKKGEKNRTVGVIEQLRDTRALVVDDNMETCVCVSRMLTSIGLRAEWTTSGTEAAFKAQYAHEDAQPFGVYIIDWLIPDLNGIEVIRRIRAVIGNDTPIIVLTAYDWSDIEQQARDAGVTAFCAKPLFLSDLYDVLLSACVKPAEPLPDTEPEAMETPFAGKRILLAEDVAMNREIAIELLEDMGLNVDYAVNGEEAVKTFCASEAGYYTLIFMDIQMPVMDGYAATRAIRSSAHPNAKTIPIVAMTANAFAEDVENAKQAGMNGHLAKPISVTELQKTVEAYMI